MPVETFSPSGSVQPPISFKNQYFDLKMLVEKLLALVKGRRGKNGWGKEEFCM
jgi:hypothetical protein